MRRLLVSWLVAAGIGLMLVRCSTFGANVAHDPADGADDHEADAGTAPDGADGVSCAAPNPRLCDGGVCPPSVTVANNATTGVVVEGNRVFFSFTYGSLGGVRGCDLPCDGGSISYSSAVPATALALASATSPAPGTLYWGRANALVACATDGCSSNPTVVRDAGKDIMSVAVTSSRIVFVASTIPEVTALQRSDGGLAWTAPLDTGQEPQLVVAGGGYVLFGTTDRVLHACSEETCASDIVLSRDLVGRRAYALAGSRAYFAATAKFGPGYDIVRCEVAQCEGTRVALATVTDESPGVMAADACGVFWSSTPPAGEGYTRVLGCGVDRCPEGKPFSYANSQRQVRALTLAPTQVFWASFGMAGGQYGGIFSSQR